MILDQLVGDVTRRKDIYGAVFYVSSPDNIIDCICASGNFNEDSQYYVASINKFFVSAIILKLYATGQIRLEDKIAKYLPEETVRGLHVLRGKDYSGALTIAHLLSLTSGLPCYLADRQASGNKAMTELEAGIDQAWPIDKVVREVKKMKPHFPPGKQGRAKYGDTNHQILSLIIENVTGAPVIIVLKNLFQELNLTRTYVCEETSDNAFVPIRYQSHVRHLPLFLTSTKDEIISTAKDQMTFLKAFFSGYFFPKERLGELEKWNDIFFPFKYGIGIQKFSLPRVFSPFHPVPDMIGHCGSTGSVAFLVPEMDIFVTGTTNQNPDPMSPFRRSSKYCTRYGRTDLAKQKFHEAVHVSSASLDFHGTGNG